MNNKQTKEFIKALDALVAEKGIDKAIIIEAMEAAMANAYKKNEGIPNAKAKVNGDTGEIRLFTYKTVVDPVAITEEQLANGEEDFEFELDEDTQITLEDARKIVDDIEVGETIDTEVKIIPESFGRVAALSAKQIVVQKVKENNSKELSLDTLDEVAGGAIGNVRYTKTTDISKDTQSKI